LHGLREDQLINSKDKTAIGLFTLIAIGSAVGLCFAAVYEITSSGGISGALNLPYWILLLALLVLSLAAIALTFVNVRRRERGRPPL
jgi:hypothetical protein